MTLYQQVHVHQISITEDSLPFTYLRLVWRLLVTSPLLTPHTIKVLKMGASIYSSGQIVSYKLFVRSNCYSSGQIVNYKLSWKVILSQTKFKNMLYLSQQRCFLTIHDCAFDGNHSVNQQIFILRASKPKFPFLSIFFVNWLINNFPYDLSSSKLGKCLQPFRTTCHHQS